MAYSEEKQKEIIIDICHKVVESKVSFNTAIEQSGISRMSFYSWLMKFEDAKNFYNYAREIRSDVIFEEILDIADDSSNDTIIRDGVEVLNNENIQRSRLRVDSRKWVAAKMSPKKYGDKIDVTSDNQKIETVDPRQVALNIKAIIDGSDIPD